MLNQSRVIKFGTFGGVFTPSILTILGIILFLRIGYVVGNGGLYEALLIIIFANAISFLTSYSLVAVATNMQIKAGGPYYIISRTLGPEWGGVIGIILFFAVSISIGFYCVGAAEVIAPMIPYFDGLHGVQLMAAIIAALLFVIAWMGADFSTRFQYIVMAILVLALLSFYIGAAEKASISQLVSSLQSGSGSPGFWYLFAVFFPAITGFTQGINMSGDLENPTQSIINGTLWAVGLSFVIYLSAAFMLASAYPKEVLQTNMHAFAQVSYLPWLIIAGTFAAAVSSALASFLGAPRILAAMGKDGLIPALNFFAPKDENDTNPRKALVFSGGIVALVVALGNLNMIATVVTVFFLLTYGLLNYATFYAAYSSSPSFRPKLNKYNKWVSFSGFIIALGAIVAVSPEAGVISAVITSLIYIFISYKKSETTNWADSRRSFKMKRIRELMLEINELKEHPLDWSPNILAFLPDRFNSWEEIIYFSSLIGGDDDILSAVHFYERHLGEKEQEEKKSVIKQTINAIDVDAFAQVIHGVSFKTGLSTLLQAYGIGTIRANTVVFGWQEQRDDPVKRDFYAKRVQTVLTLGVNLVIIKTSTELWRPVIKKERLPAQIDIWWDEKKTGQLMLIMAFLARQTPDWENVKIRILAQHNKQNRRSIREDFQALIDEARIDADVKLIPQINQEAVFEHSLRSTLVFMPMKLFGTINEGYVGKLLDDSRFDMMNFALFIAKEDIQLDADLDSDQGDSGNAS